MTTILIIINVVLIIIVIILLTSQKEGKANNIFTKMEDFELLEFQDNLKSLITELNKVSSTSVRDMETKKYEVEKLLGEAEFKIREMKYLIERVQLLKKPSIKPEPQKNETGILKFAPKDIREENSIPNENINELSKKSNTKFIIDDTEVARNKEKYKYDNIENLLKQGMPINEIAKITNLTIGEIELIRNLKK